MSYREEMALNFKMDIFKTRKAKEHPEIIDLEKWARHEHMPKKKYSANGRRNIDTILGTAS